MNQLLNKIYEISYIWTAQKDIMKIFLIIAAPHTTWEIVKLKPAKYSSLSGIRTHDQCPADAVLYQLSYQALWELGSVLERPGYLKGPKSCFEISLKKSRVCSRL